MYKICRRQFSQDQQGINRRNCTIPEFPHLPQFPHERSCFETRSHYINTKLTVSKSNLPAKLDSPEPADVVPVLWDDDGVVEDGGVELEGGGHGDVGGGGVVVLVDAGEEGFVDGTVINSIWCQIISYH